MDDQIALLIRCRSVLITALNERFEDIENPSRRSVLERLINDINIGITKSGWQPIESAPNWQNVLATDGKHCFIAQRFNIGSPRMPAWSWYAMHGDGVATTDDYGPSTKLEEDGYGTQLTHWMPLPGLP
jgi:hypothetical protein